MTSSPLVHRFHTAPQAVSLHSSHHSSAGISWIFVVVVILITISTAETIQKLVPNLTHFSLAPFEYRSSKESDSVLVYKAARVVSNVSFHNNTLQASAGMCSDCESHGVQNISDNENAVNITDMTSEDDPYFRNDERYFIEPFTSNDEMLVNSTPKHELLNTHLSSRKSVRSNSISVTEEHASPKAVTKLPHMYRISAGNVYSVAKKYDRHSKLTLKTENSSLSTGPQKFGETYNGTNDDPRYEFLEDYVTPVAVSEWNSNNYDNDDGGNTLLDGYSYSSGSVRFSNTSLINTEVPSPSVSYSLDYYSDMEFRKVREYFHSSKRTNSKEVSSTETNFPNFMGFPLEPPRHLLYDPNLPKVLSRSLTKTGDDFPSTSNQEKSKSAGNVTERVSILGLFEMSNRWGDRPEGRSELAAAKLAVKHVNERDVLPGFHLELHTNDTKCDPGVGVDAFFHALYTQNTTRTVMLLGSACSDVTESLAKVVPYWNIVQVSFGSTSPALSDRREFPLFCRTVAPDSSHNPARLAFVKKYGWDTVTALSQNEDVYSLAVNDLVTELEQANITCRSTITFAESDFKDQLRLVRDLDTRIIIGSFSPKVAPKIFCEAHQLGMFGADYAWILQGGPGSNWWRNASEHCPQLAKAVEGLLLVSSHNSLVGDIPAVSGLTNAGFLEEFSRLSLPVTRYAPQTYDAVWAMALALGAAHRKWQSSADHQPSMRNFDYNRKDMADEFLRQMNNLNFLGVSGPVSFNGADRVGISAFYQVQDGNVAKVALFYPETSELNFSCPDCKPPKWQGGQVPVARREFRLRVVTIDTAAFMSVTCLAVVGISLAVAFLAFNLHFRKLKYIKLSSPRLNNMAVVGCILVYTAVILLGLDHATLPTSTHFPTVCTARVYLLSAGFSLAFGSMFTKTYRVHRIFTRSRSGVVKNKLLQDTQLISLICVLLLIDGLIVTLWVIIDPIQRHLRNLTLEISASDRSVVYQPQVEVCRSQYIHGWLGALYVYKGLLLVVGVYMAWETRHVKIPALNDSQYIGMSVYSVVITSAIVVVLANLISERATLAFVTITALILTSTTTTLCLLFLPKLHAILGRAAHADPIVHSMGLKIECNTRRFVMDDRRELYYRVEVQNRVYRREMAALDLEIGRLRRQLVESPTASSGGSTSSMGASKRGELSPLDVTALARLSLDENSLQPSAGVGGGLPMLLLSVLPPVIPRASWPSADPGTLHMRRQVTFSSEPKLDDSTITKSIGGADSGEDFCRYDPDTPLSETSTKLGVFSRLWSFLGSKPSSRKTSTASFTGGATSGIASALRMHMGYLAGIVPNSNNPNAMTSSCNTSATMINQYGLASGQNVAASSRELHPLKKLCGRTAGGSGPIISVTSNDEHGIDSIIFDGSGGRRKFSLGMCLSRKEEKELEEGVAPRVSLPLQKLRIQHQHSQPILPFRERAKGSPRFPHKIVPTCSLNALEDRRKSSSSAGGSSYGGGASSTIGSNFYAQFVRRRSSQHHLHVKSKHYDQLLGDKCRSLEDARTLDVTRSGSGSASSGAAQSATGAPSTSNWKPRAASYSPNCDVWGTAEFGIPLSELGSGTRTRDRSAPSCVVPPEGLACQ